MRQKKHVISNVTREQAEAAMAVFSDAANAIQKIEASMNADINAVRDKYQHQLTSLAEAKDEEVAILEVYAQETAEQWGKRKSFELLHGTIGYRTGTPKVKFDKGFNAKNTATLLEATWADYVRKTVEIDKEKIIADREAENFAQLCKAGHFEVVQDESFYVESKAEVLQVA